MTAQYLPNRLNRDSKNLVFDLYGEPVSFVYPELERRITEALTWDERIQSVDGFEFNSTEKGSVCVSFAVHTIYGDIQAEKEVNF